MNIDKTILSYITDHPGRSSERIFSYINTNIEDPTKCITKSFVFKKLRILKKEGKLHNISNLWFPLKRSS